ncbi:MAG: cyclase family protein [Nocardiopsaceae bacterium]|nr:cyclase family protein [Nocardiopsaceae bacterium]
MNGRRAPSMDERRAQVPIYRELLARTDGPPGSSWGVFGPDDQLGTLNFLTEQATIRAAGLVSAGRVYNLDYPLNTFVPSIAGTRPASEHHMFSNNPNHRDDWLDSFYLQSTTQIDGLRHIRHPEYGFYGGVKDEAIEVGRPELGIQLVAEKGIAGRGVLIDLPRYFEAAGRDYDLTTNQMIWPSDLDAALEAQGVALESGDILLVRTGWSGYYLGLAPEERERRRRDRRAPGLGQSPEMVGYLWDHQVAVVASDNAGVEAHPVNPDSGFVIPGEPVPERGPSHNGMMHRPLIALLGLFLGECWKLDELAEACAADGTYEFLLTAKPLNLIGGVGSPANALAVK